MGNDSAFKLQFPGLHIELHVEEVMREGNVSGARQTRATNNNMNRILIVREFLGLGLFDNPRRSEFKLRFGYFLVTDDGPYLFQDFLFARFERKWVLRWQARLVFSNILELILGRRFLSNIKLGSIERCHVIPRQERP